MIINFCTAAGRLDTPLFSRRSSNVVSRENSKNVHFYYNIHIYINYISVYILKINIY